MDQDRCAAAGIPEDAELHTKPRTAMDLLQRAIDAEVRLRGSPRMSISDPTEIAYYICYAPRRTTLATLIRVAGRRWPVEECFNVPSSTGRHRCCVCTVSVGSAVSSGGAERPSQPLTRWSA